MRTSFVKIVRYALVFLLWAVSFTLSAQGNLREGYVITLQGDTLHGDIDFRTGTMNLKQCVFRQDGTSAFKTYLPGEIQGYRFLNNGIYYVSKKIDAGESGTQEIFAEYILRGNMNLYQVGEDEMVLEDEDGNSAAFSYVKAQRASSVKERQQEMREVLGMLSKSANATNIIWKKDKNRENTKQAVTAYIDEVCTDGQCEVFEYPSKVKPKEDRVMHPWVKAGFKVTTYKFWNGETITGCGPQVTAGFDFHLNRVLNGLMASAAIAFEQGNADHEVTELKDNLPMSVDFKQLDVQIGPGYQFQAGPVIVRAKCGAIYRLASRNFKHSVSTRLFSLHEPTRVVPEEREYKMDSQFGLYAGAGVEYRLKKYALLCDLDYIYDYNKWTKYRLAERTLVKQHGVCLSAGVKF